MLVEFCRTGPPADHRVRHRASGGRLSRTPWASGRFDTFKCQLCCSTAAEPARGRSVGPWRHSRMGPTGGSRPRPLQLQQRRRTAKRHARSASEPTSETATSSTPCVAARASRRSPPPLPSAVQPYPSWPAATWRHVQQEVALIHGIEVSDVLCWRCRRRRKSSRTQGRGPPRRGRLAMAQSLPLSPSSAASARPLDASG